MNLMKSASRFLKKNGGTILAIGASVGVVLTAIETGKASTKAEKLIEMNSAEPAYTMKEKVQDCWKFYLPAAALGAGTIACILGSNALNKKQIASLTAGYMALGKAYQEYRREVAEHVGAEHEKEIYKDARSVLKEPTSDIWYYKLDSIDEVTNPDMWLKANPNLGQTVSYETYQLDVERAEKAPGSRNDILAKRFNIPMEGYTYFFPYEETLPHRHRDYWQMPCALGADLSQGDDFCAFTFLFPMANGFFGVKTRDYITSYTLSKLPQAMRQKYDQFMQEGTLQVFDGTVLDMMQVYDDLDNFIQQNDYDVRCFGYDPYNAKDFVERWCTENAPFGVEKVIQGAKTESVPLGELKKLSEQRKLLFDEALMQFAMGNCIALEDTNGNRKLLKRRSDQKIDAVAAMMDAYIAWKLNREAFE